MDAGCGGNDSPVGLAAYILEKFSTWTDNSNRALADGGLERYKPAFSLTSVCFISAYQLNYRSVQRCCCCFFINSTHIYLYRKFSLDDVLTNVMIYWTTGSIVSSMRFYKENFKSNPDNRVDAKYVAKCSYGRDHDLFYKMDNPIIQSHCDNVSSLF